MQLNQFPEYVRAVQRGDRLDDYWRDFTFLGLNETLRIAGTRVASDESASPEESESARPARTVEVRQLTLQMFIELCAVRSPFLVGGNIRPEHVAQILWRLSPEYSHAKAQSRKGVEAAVSAANELTPRQQFVASIASLPFRASVRSISRYLERMFLDKPPERTKSGGSRPDTSLAASIIHELATAYGWSDEQILNIPMPRLFQYLRKIQRGHDPKMPFFNPTRDKLKARAFNRIREKLSRSTGVPPVGPTGILPVAGLMGEESTGETPIVPTGKMPVLPQTSLDVIGTDGCKAATETIQPAAEGG